MQVMPATARLYKVSPERLFDPETSIRLANRILIDIYAALKLPASTSTKDKMSITLACYNGGIGHVTDARKLARKHGENDRSWPVVVKYLELLADPVYYGDAVVRHGRFRGSKETREFVEDVMRSYAEYCKKTS